MKLADFTIISTGVLLNALAQLGLKAASRDIGPLSLVPPQWSQLLAVLAVPALWWALIAYGVSVVIWVVGLLAGARGNRPIRSCPWATPSIFCSPGG